MARNINLTRVASSGLRAAGMYHGANIMRAVSDFGIGAEMSSAATGTATSIASLGLAIGGVIAAVKLVEIGFKAVAETAMSVVGAITQIGGARGLQSMLVESSASQRMATDIANNTADGVDRSQVLGELQRISSNTEWSKQQVGEMARGFIAKRGSFAEFDKMGSFIAKIASVANLTPEQAGGLAGQMRVQFPELSIEKTQEALASLWQAGKQGAVELKDATHITQALGFARAVSPNVISGLNLEMGLVQASQRYVGGETAQTAVTGVRTLQADLFKNQGKLTPLLGAGYITHTETGQAVFKNMPEILAKLSLASYEHGKVQGIDERAAKSLRGFVTGETGAEFKGLGEKDKLKVLEDMFLKMETTGDGLERLKEAFERTQDTIEYRLKQSFNELANGLEAEFIPILIRDVIPAVKDFTHQLLVNKDDVADAFKAVVGSLVWLSQAFLTAARVFHLIDDKRTTTVKTEDAIKAALDEKAGKEDEARKRRVEQLGAGLTGLPDTSPPPSQLMSLGIKNASGVNPLKDWMDSEEAKDLISGKPPTAPPNVYGAGRSSAAADPATADRDRIFRSMEAAIRHELVPAMQSVDRKTVPQRPQPPTASTHGK